ncbi:hypothetical protein [Pseudalgibacter alginicilyticus]|uniref:hypothetical protein n=1 Tax=Pseudalgibacter alginicilyticus TaxID=1736674 RepID=UPI0012FE2512|nr:hypothetical protein [Pseudalgibacter alginicilyticus]
MEEKINEALQYYLYKREGILKYINGNDNLSAVDIIENAEELSILEAKISSFQQALED